MAVVLFVRDTYGVPLVSKHFSVIEERERREKAIVISYFINFEHYITLILFSYCKSTNIPWTLVVKHMRL